MRSAARWSWGIGRRSGSFSSSIAGPVRDRTGAAEVRAEVTFKRQVLRNAGSRAGLYKNRLLFPHIEQLRNPGRSGKLCKLTFLENLAAIAICFGLNSGLQRTERAGPASRWGSANHSVYYRPAAGGPPHHF